MTRFEALEKAVAELTAARDEERAQREKLERAQKRSEDRLGRLDALGAKLAADQVRGAAEFVKKLGELGKKVEKQAADFLELEREGRESLRRVIEAVNAGGRGASAGAKVGGKLGGPGGAVVGALGGAVVGAATAGEVAEARRREEAAEQDRENRFFRADQERAATVAAFVEQQRRRAEELEEFRRQERLYRMGQLDPRTYQALRRALRRSR